ncbi:hypothetical protein [Burkholderia ubonensis]|uniref:hypothetical protein n=1 Tax=Burkholderia ubonensis TaxID=101571 RepID=UPI0012F7D31C|nr:hypothetical protein [Burkholderia ubonensis]
MKGPRAAAARSRRSIVATIGAARSPRPHSPSPSRARPADESQWRTVLRIGHRVELSQEATDFIDDCFEGSTARPCRNWIVLGPVHANNGLALAARRAEREEWDEANTERIRKEHDAAIGPSGGQPHK